MACRCGAAPSLQSTSSSSPLLITAAGLLCKAGSRTAGAACQRALIPRTAAPASDKRALDLHLPYIDAASRALLLSQAEPHAARAPVAPRTCACRGRLGPLGDHRAACATSDVLASRALPLERAVAMVCQEAGARAARNVRLADMNIDVPVSDDRRIEERRFHEGRPYGKSCQWLGTHVAVRHKHCDLAFPFSEGPTMPNHEVLGNRFA